MLDRKTLTTAYPHLTVSGGKGANPASPTPKPSTTSSKHKGDRDDVGDRVARGLNDSFLPDGGQHRVFEPLWWRTWRYLDLDIATGDRAAHARIAESQLHRLSLSKSAPNFESGDPDLDKIWEISWRTARLDAHETYMDTPYYEQLQYIGDTRIQALISYTVAGDDRLARQALDAFNDSRIPEGITRSRYPSSLPQNIPTFSLLWIGMLHDYWMYRPDPQFVRDDRPGTRASSAGSRKYETPTALLDKLPWWSFIDWVPSGEIPTYDANGESCITTLEYLGALDRCRRPRTASRRSGARCDAISPRSTHVRSGLAANAGTPCTWPPRRQPRTRNVQPAGQHSRRALRRDSEGAAAGRAAKRAGHRAGHHARRRALSASYYFRFYLARALEHAGMADDYLNSLDPWRKLLPLHFSTWPEIPGDTRSDSHAWTSHPIYDLLTLVAGIEPASPDLPPSVSHPHLGSADHAHSHLPASPWRNQGEIPP